MVAGDVSVEILNPIIADIDSAVSAAVVTANDKYFFIPLAGGQQIMFIHIEEA